THTITVHGFVYLPINQSFQFTQNPVRYTGRLSYLGRYELAPTLNGFLGFGGAIAPLNTFNPAIGPAAAQLTATPTGYAYNFLGDATIGVAKQVSPKLTVTESEGFSGTLPINTNPLASRVYRLNSAVTVTKIFSLDNLRTSLNIGYTYFGIG